MARRRKLANFYKSLPDDRKAYAKRMVDQLEFMESTLDRLKETIEQEGPTITAVNGNGFETRQEHPAQKSYNTMIKNYNSTIRILVGLLPELKKDEADEFEKFLRGE